MIILWLLKLGITMLIHNKDDIHFVTEFPCLLGHPVYDISPSLPRNDTIILPPPLALLIKLNPPPPFKFFFTLYLIISVENIVLFFFSLKIVEF